MGLEQTNGTPYDLKDRTRKYAIRVINLYSSLPKRTVAQVIGRQLLRSGTSVGAHYRESRRSRSNAEYISKLEGALQELDETAYWMELIVESKIFSQKRMQELITETDELISILTSWVKNAKKRKIS